MTSFYLFPRRPAAAQSSILLLSLLLVASCEPGQLKEGLGPEDTEVAVVEVTPETPVVTVGQVVLVHASARLSNGQPTAAEVDWSADGGTLAEVTDSTTQFSATLAGSYWVRGRHRRNRQAQDSTTITVTNPTPILQAVILTPPSAALATGAAQQFGVSGQWSNGSTTAPAVIFNATGGTITSGGLYTAGSAAGTFRVVATHQGGTLADTATVTLTATPPVLQAVLLSPSSASLATGATQQFSVTGQWSNGATTAPSVTYSATGGTVTSGGLYTAGSTAGTFRVIAVQQGGTLADTSVVTITAPVLQAVILTPASTSLSTGATRQFSVSGQWSNGATTAPAVTYTATGGTITSGGLYTAGGTAGTFRVIAVQQGGTLADTAIVTLTAPVLQAVILTPASVTVFTGSTQQFGVSGQWSNGATTAPSVTYTATGGTIAAGGLYTAGATTGTYRVIAVQQGGTLADTSVVTLTQASPGSMYFNSAEAGCGTDSNILLCDDFEDGDWYTKHCDAANASGGLLQTDGWCGTIYNNAGLTAGTARCGGVGFRSACAATTGAMPSGTDGKTGNMGDHALANGQGVEEIWVRFYTKPLAGYQFGAEKMLTFNDGNPGGAGIRWGNLSWNCAGSTQSVGNLTMGIPVPQDECMRPNVGSNITIQSGNWYFYEVHYRLSTPGQANGVFELWVDNCGPTGTTCPASPTLRMRRTDVNNGRTSTSELIRVLWFEAWSNPVSLGERYWDQIKVSKAGPIGFMP